MIPSAIATMISTIPKLDDTNWFTWIKKMKMIFLAVGLEGIASGSPPTEAAQKTKWDALDRQMLAYLYMAISDDFQHLVEDEDSASAGWVKLKEHFQRSTLGARMNARKEFFDVVHDPERSISHYVHSVMAARQKLEALGCIISDTETMDVLLMRLDSSYEPVRLTILSQKTEPTLADVKTILTSSGASDPVIIKSEPIDSVLASQEGRRRTRRTSLTDEKGFIWCNTDRDGVCHRCGRAGHIAARCMYNMPQAVKDYIMSNRPSSSSSQPPEDKANISYHAYSAYEDTGVGPLLI